MTTTVNVIGFQNNEFILCKSNVESIRVNEKSILSIDGSTTNSGLSILRQSDGALFYTIAAARDKDESPVKYKVLFKQLIYEILKNNKLIDMVYYEEPFIGFASNVSNLFMLRSTVEELIVEHEAELSYVKHSEINNMRWKKLFLAPNKCPQGTELQKAAVKDKLIKCMPYLSQITQDECDSLGMGFVACTSLKNGTEDELESKKKVTAFQYNITFIGANSDDDMLTVFNDTYDGPKKLLENGIIFTSIKGTTNFDKHVYRSLAGCDRVLIVKFPSKTHGDIILKNRLGYLSQDYEYIYALVWRKTRKS